MGAIQRVLEALPEEADYEILICRKILKIQEIKNSNLDLQGIEAEISRGSPTQETRDKYLHYSFLAGNNVKQLNVRVDKLAKWFRRFLQKRVDEGTHGYGVEIVQAFDEPQELDKEEQVIPMTTKPKTKAKAKAKAKAKPKAKAKSKAKAKDDLPF